ncbi:MAG: hypothetical protein LBU32_07295 [Clostridiales bacterium]|nr:hypothetical protein [Clostridiales bacterium]
MPIRQASCTFPTSDRLHSELVKRYKSIFVYYSCRNPLFFQCHPNFCIKLIFKEGIITDSASGTAKSANPISDNLLDTGRRFLLASIFYHYIS